ncbi:MAG: hypothetical protein ACR2NP_21390 [Pirellulaceae bacterium]
MDLQTTNTTIGRNSRKQPARLVAAAVLLIPLLLSCVFTAECSAQRYYDDPEFLDFSSRDVPTPDDLLKSLQILNHLQQQQANSSLLEQIRQSGDDFFSDLSPEQQRALMDSVRSYLDRINRGEQPAVPEAFEEYLREMMSEGDLPESLRNLMDSLPESRQPFRPDVPPPTDSTTPWRLPDFRPSELDPGTSPELPGRNGPPVSRENAEELGRQYLERWQELDRNTNPNPDVDSRLFEPGESGDNTINAPDTGEWIGVRFDRLLLRAAENSRLNESSFGSGLAESMDSLFDGMISNLQSTFENHESSGGGLSSRVRSRMSSGSEGLWSALRSPSASNAIPEVAQVSWWLLGGMALVLAGLLFWVARRVLGEASYEEGVEYPRRRFRVPKVGTSDDLVRAVDGYLLATFGAASQWWHARHAEVALCTDQPLMSQSIGELVDCYESARYSRAGAAAVSASQLERCRDILKQISRRKPVSAAAAGDDEEA